MDSRNIISWNCNGLYSHLEDLKVLTAEYQPTIVCIQETHLKHNQFYNFPNYNSFQSAPVPDAHAKGGVLIAVKSNIHHERINLQTNLQILATKIYTSTPFTLCTAYFPPGENLSEDHLRSVIRSLPPPFILLGDFNSHNPLWGSTRCNRNGKILEHILIDGDMTIINSSTKTHFNFSYKTWSNLDLVFCSPQLSSSLYVHTHVDLGGSDHSPIIVNLNFYQSAPSLQSIQRINYKKTDWKKYQAHCENRFEPQTIQISNSTDSIVESFTNDLVSYALECSPKMKPFSDNKKLRFVPWWITDCTKALRERCKALKQLKKNYTDENFVNYRRL